MLYPIMTETRQVIDLNGIWNFKLDKGTGFEEKWNESGLKDAIRMAVPSSYNDLVEGAEFRDHVGWVWYEREFIINKNNYIKKYSKVKFIINNLKTNKKITLNGKEVSLNNNSIEMNI